MNDSENPTDLERLAAEELAELLDRVPPGSSLSIDSSSPVCSILELLIPSILRQKSAEWEQESIDGFFFSSTAKTGDASVALTGTCILIRDQSVTPFDLRIRLSDHGFDALRVRLGEPGGGVLGISGPACNSKAALQLLHNLEARAASIDWVYDVQMGDSA